MKHLGFIIFLLLAPAATLAGPIAQPPTLADGFAQPAPEQPGGIGLAERLRDLSDGAVLYDAACCKVCGKGKACGDSCISRSKTCQKGRGCACDG